MRKFVSAAVILTIASSAMATTIYSTSFEAPTFVAGPLNGQSTWVADAGSITNNPANAHSGNQFASMTGSQLGSASKWAWETTHALSPATLAINPIVRASVYVAMGGNAGTRVFSGGLDLYDTSVLRIGQILIASDGSLALLDGLGNSATVPAGSINPNIYHQLAVEVNYATSSVGFYVDGTLIATGGHAATDFSDADLRGFRSTGTGGNAFLTAFDDYAIELVPAPSALALMGVGGLIAGRRRRA